MKTDERTSGQTLKASPGAKRPGDQVPQGTPQSAENTCEQCAGSGRSAQGPCPECAGTGFVTTLVGDA